MKRSSTTRRDFPAFVRSLRRLWFTLLVVSIICHGPVTWAMDGVEPIGLSHQSISRGGADVAVGDSALSQVENPATLTLSPPGSWRVDTAGELLMPRLQWTGPRDSAYSTIRHIPIGHVGLVLPGGERWRFGLAIYSKSQLASAYKMRTALDPYINRHMDANLRNFSLMANAAYRVTDKLSVGAGLRGELLTGDFTSVSGPSTLEFGRGVAFGAGFQLGLHYRITPTLAAGVGYRSPTWFQEVTGNDSKSSLAGDWQGSFLSFRPAYFGKASVENIRLPQKVSAGLCWDATDRLRLVGEGRWIGYSRSVLNTADFVVGGPLTIRVPAPVGYRDQWALMGGAEVKLSEHWKWACGYHYGSNPISRTALLPIAALVTQHHLTTGLRYEKDNWWVGIGYVAGLRESFRSGGTTRIPFGVDYANTEVVQMQHSITCGFGLTW